MASFQFSQTEKFKQTHYRRQTMTIVFCDQKGMFFVDFMKPGVTITSKSVVKRFLNCAVQNVTGNTEVGIVLLHFNARLHTAAHTIKTIQKFLR